MSNRIPNQKKKLSKAPSHKNFILFTAHIFLKDGTPTSRRQSSKVLTWTSFYHRSHPPIKILKKSLRDNRNVIVIAIKKPPTKKQKRHDKKYFVAFSQTYVDTHLNIFAKQKYIVPQHICSPHQKQNCKWTENRAKCIIRSTMR